MHQIYLSLSQVTMKVETMTYKHNYFIQSITDIFLIFMLSLFYFIWIYFFICFYIIMFLVLLVLFVFCHTLTFMHTIMAKCFYFCIYLPYLKAQFQLPMLPTASHSAAFSYAASSEDWPWHLGPLCHSAFNQ